MTELTRFTVTVEVELYAEDAEHAAEIVTENLFPVAGEDNLITSMAMDVPEVFHAFEGIRLNEIGDTA